jgi:hypothetical protein
VLFAVNARDNTAQCCCAVQGCRREDSAEQEAVGSELGAPDGGGVLEVRWRCAVWRGGGPEGTWAARASGQVGKWELRLVQLRWSASNSGAAHGTRCCGVF